MSICFRAAGASRWPVALAAMAAISGPTWSRTPVRRASTCSGVASPFLPAASIFATAAAQRRAFTSASTGVRSASRMEDSISTPSFFDLAGPSTITISGFCAICRASAKAAPTIFWSIISCTHLSASSLTSRRSSPVKASLSARVLRGWESCLKAAGQSLFLKFSSTSLAQSLAWRLSSFSWAASTSKRCDSTPRWAASERSLRALSYFLSARASLASLRMALPWSMRACSAGSAAVTGGLSAGVSSSQAGKASAPSVATAKRRTSDGTEGERRAMAGGTVPSGADDGQAATTAPVA